MLTFTVLPAQVILAKGSLLPIEGKQNDWFWDTLNFRIYHHEEGQWQLFRGLLCTKASACNNFLELEFGDVQKEVLTAWGAMMGPIMPEHFTMQCHGALTLLQSDLITWLYGPDGKIMAEILNNGCPEPKLDTIKGLPGFCVPAILEELPVLRRFPCEELKNWGFLGVNGQWLIPPIYDSPFHFENGLARVSYYGQIHSINENGESVR